MKNLHFGHCVVAIAAAAPLLVALGVSGGTLAVLAAALACPLVMLLMMREMVREMTGGHASGRRDDDDHGLR